MAETSSLLNCRTGDCTGGSNPPLSANLKIMKKGIISLFSLAVSTILITSCGGGGEHDASQMKVYNYEKADSLSIDYLKELGSVKVNIEQSAKLYGTLRESGYSFDGSLMSPSSTNFSSSKQQALGLGVFAASLAYGAVFEQQQNTTEYMGAIFGLADKLGISDAFDKNLMEKLTSNDTTLNKNILLTKAYVNATDQLYSEDRAQLVTMMVAGGFIEGLLISTGATKVRFGNAEINYGIYEQVYSYDNTIKMLEVYKDNADVGEVYKAFKEQEDVFKGVIKLHTPKKMKESDIEKLNAAVTQLKSKLL